LRADVAAWAAGLSNDGGAFAFERLRLINFGCSFPPRAFAFE
jgi:hypothetical protein